MKYPTMIPTLALATLAAAASAQTAPVKSRAGAPEQFSVGIAYAKSNDMGATPGADADATTLDIRAAIAGNVFLTAAYSDVSIDNLPGSPSAWSVGLGAKFAAGNGNVEASYAYRNVDTDIIGNFKQHWIRLGYNLDLGNGFNIGLTAVEVLNETAFGDDVTAAEIALGYAFGKGFSANLSYATEDLIVGEKLGNGTLSIGLRYGF